jgi:DNA-binding MarR family transcriptional regulator
MSAVAEIRDFNRFYTRQIGLLDAHLPTSDLTLAEGRILYELATAGEQIAAELCRKLTMDKAYFSRMATRLKGRGLIAARTNPSHGRQKLLSLTDKGHSAFAAADQGTRTQMEGMLAPLDGPARRELIAAMRQIRRSLRRTGNREQPVKFRPLRPGDIGWVTHRQALLYHQDYGWDLSFEALVADILAKFAANFDPMREDAWIAELHEEAVGSIFLAQSDDPAIAKLRLLYVEPEARGLHRAGARARL